MDQIVVDRLKRLIYVEYRCELNGDFVSETEYYEDLKSLGVVNNGGLCSNLLDLVIPSERDRVGMELASQLAKGDDIELMLPIDVDKWVLNKARRVTSNGKTVIEGILVPVSRIMNIYSAQQNRLAEYELRLNETIDRASRDSLTTLYNAKMTRLLCEEYIKGGEKNFALLMIDLDNFKSVNDNFGHIEGDKALASVSEIIKNLFRNNDIVGRVGGDEFLVLIKDIDARDIVEARSSQIISSLKKNACGNMPEGELSCSVGAVFSRGNRKKYDEIFSAADKAMYDAKKDGKNRYKVIEL